MSVDRDTSSVPGMELPPRHVPVHENDLGRIYVILDESVKAGLLPDDMIRPLLTILDRQVEIVNLMHFRAIMALLDSEGWEP